MPAKVTATPSTLDRWLRSWELLAAFPQWPEFAGEAMTQFWDSQEEDGLWNRGPQPSGSPR